MDECIFCKIVKGEIPSYKIYEDDNTFVFLDINPLSKGHTIVIPKSHYEGVLDIPEGLYSDIAKTVRRVAIKLNEKYKPDGILINQNNGERAGQIVPHVHVHVKPIYKDTTVFDETKHRKVFSDADMSDIQKELCF